MRKDISTKTCNFFLIFFNYQCSKNAYSRAPVFFPTSSFQPLLHFDPYQSSEVPFFLVDLLALWPWKLCTLNLPVTGPQDPLNGAPQRIDMDSNETSPGGKAQNKDMGKKLVIMFEYRVFKLWKKSDKFLKEYLSRTVWPIWVIWKSKDIR